MTIINLPSYECIVLFYFQFCTWYEVSDKNLYPTFARTKYHDSSISKSVVSLLNKFNWKKVVFVHSDDLQSVADTVYNVSNLLLISIV